jgi:hypothetical protein
VRRLTAPPRAAGQSDAEIALMERLLRETEGAPDRRAHRAAVLAGYTAGPVQCWRQRRPRDPEAPESFFATIRAEIGAESWLDHAAARRDIENWIKSYNERRLHSSLGYRTPIESQIA